MTVERVNVDPDLIDRLETSGVDPNPFLAGLLEGIERWDQQKRSRCTIQMVQCSIVKPGDDTDV